ncbi:hypothetical protein SBADM41S_11553 [Streptomyces badius]
MTVSSSPWIRSRTVVSVRGRRPVRSLSVEPSARNLAVYEKYGTSPRAICRTSASAIAGESPVRRTTRFRTAERTTGSAMACGWVAMRSNCVVRSSPG